MVGGHFDDECWLDSSDGLPITNQGTEAAGRDLVRPGVLALGKFEQLGDGTSLTRPQAAGTADDDELTGEVVLAENEPVRRGERSGHRADDSFDGVADADLQPVSFARPI